MHFLSPNPRLMNRMIDKIASLVQERPPRDVSLRGSSSRTPRRRAARAFDPLRPRPRASIVSLSPKDRRLGPRAVAARPWRRERGRRVEALLFSRRPSETPHRAGAPTAPPSRREHDEGSAPRRVRRRSRRLDPRGCSGCARVSHPLRILTSREIRRSMARPRKKTRESPPATAR